MDHQIEPKTGGPQNGGAPVFLFQMEGNVVEEETQENWYIIKQYEHKFVLFSADIPLKVPHYPSHKTSAHPI